MKKMNSTEIKTGLLAALCSISLLAGCTTPGKKTAIGAGAGGALGAAVGGATGGWKGAAIGAGIGALSGGSIGNYLDHQAKELNQVADTHRTADGILVKLKNDLLFDTGSATLKPEATDTLAQLGDILSKYPEDRIRVEGYTDNVGKLAFNEDLSLRRAKSVQDVLSQRGVKPNQMITVGYGQNNPISSNKTSQGRSMNRRVQLKIDVPPGQAG